MLRSVSTCTDHSPFEKDIYEEVASLGEVLVVVATDIDGNSDGSSVVYSVTPTVSDQNMSEFSPLVCA